MIFCEPYTVKNFIYNETGDALTDTKHGIASFRRAITRIHMMPPQQEDA